MQLMCLKTLWGFPGTADEAISVAVNEGYDGIEGPIPATQPEGQWFSQALKTFNLSYIAEIATTGTYVPDRGLSLEDHLRYLRQQLILLEGMPVTFVTCLGGCDAWSINQSVEFFHRAMAMAADHGYAISFETHRGRSLFNPWVTRDIVAQVPAIKLTLDISHWVVVCEGLQATEEALTLSLSKQIQHIHARVGFDQGPQVPDPRSGIYQQDFKQHLHLWQRLWSLQSQQGRDLITLTPEFGPDGYQYRNLGGTDSLVDVAEINRFIASTLREHFAAVFPPIYTVK